MGPAIATPFTASSPVLCVDLDGTLIRGDLFWECVLALLRTRPLTLLLVPFWLLSGRAVLKHQLAARIHLDPASLPYRQPVLDFLLHEKAAGRRIALVTAADRELAETVASYLGFFDEVHASDGQVNLKGANKAAFLSQRFAENGFEYMGDSGADVEVWRCALAAYVVGSDARAEQAATVTTLKATILDSRPYPQQSTFRSWINALRGHHWAKNLLPLSSARALAQPRVRAHSAHSRWLHPVRILRLRTLHSE
jgi:phosphoserine phosphatase